MSDDNLTIARRKLNTVLADKAPMYFAEMKQWFRMINSKEKFDAEARKLLNPEQVHFHDEFLLALLNKVVGLLDSPVSFAHERAFSYGKNRKQRVATSTVTNPEKMARFDLVNPLPPMSTQGAGFDVASCAAQEIFLPDQALVTGRFMLAAWDHDLERVEDDAAKIVVLATQMLVKNVLAAVISQCKSYETKGRFRFGTGAETPNVWVRNTKVMDARLREVMPVGFFSFKGLRLPPEELKWSEDEPSSLRQGEPVTLTLKDVYTTLMANRNIIGSHSVYSVIMERIVNMLSHPSD